MDNKMNIIEAYLKEFGQMIILLIGMPTSNKSNIAKELESDIEPKFTLININDYFEKKIINIEAKNINFKLYDHPDNINYSKLFDDVNKKKSKGVILYGNSIDTVKVKDLNIDFSYFFDIKSNILKNNLINKKKLPFDDEINIISNVPNNINISNANIINKNKENSQSIDSNSSDSDSDNSSDSSSDNSSVNSSDSSSDSSSVNSTDSSKVSDNSTDSLKVSDNSTDSLKVSDNSTDSSKVSDNNKNTDTDKINLKLEIYIKDILVPIYDNIKKNIKFNKFYNIKEDTKFNDIYDNLFDNLIYLIKKKLNQPVDDKSKSSKVHLDSK